MSYKGLLVRALVTATCLALVLSAWCSTPSTASAAQYPIWRVQSQPSASALNVRWGPGIGYGVYTSVGHWTTVAGMWDTFWADGGAYGWGTWRRVYAAGNWGWSFDENGTYDSLLLDGYWYTPATYRGISPASPDGENGWYKSIPLVWLSSDYTTNMKYNWNQGGNLELSGYYYGGSFAAPQGANWLNGVSQHSNGVWGDWYSWYVPVDSIAPANPAVTSSMPANNPSHSATITLSWSGAADAVSGVAGSSWTFDTTPATVPDTVLDSGSSTVRSALAPGSHYFHIRTKDNAGNWSSTAHYGPYIVDASPPSAPVLSASSVTTSTVGLTWTPATDSGSGVAGYTIFRLDGTAVASPAGTNFTVSGLDAGTPYGYYVVAVDLSGNHSEPSNVLMVTTEFNPAPVTSAAVSPASPDGGGGWYSAAPAVTLSSSGTSMHYSWEASCGPWATCSSPITAPEGANTLYYFATKSGCTTETVKSLSLSVDTVAPSASTLSTTRVTTSTVGLSWVPVTDAGSDIARYDVYCDGILETTTGEPACVVAGLTPFSEYRFTVRAVDVAGHVSNPSDELLVRTGSLEPPVTTVDGLSSDWYSASESVKATFLATDASAGVAETWVKLPGSSARQVARGAEIDLGPSTDFGEGVNTIEFWSVSDAGVEEWPHPLATINVDTQAPATPAPSGSVDGVSALGVSWTPVPDAAEYRLYGTGGLPLATTTEHAVAFNGLTPGATYAYTVVAVDVAGNPSPPSAPLLLTTAHPYSTTFGPGIRLDFDAVTDEGVSSASAPVDHGAPPGMRLVGTASYEITTTAAFMGQVAVSVPYDRADLTGVAESSLRLFHWSDGAWQDITAGAVDTQDCLVTGVTTSFSPFAVFAPTSKATGPASWSPTQPAIGETVFTSTPTIAVPVSDPNGFKGKPYYGIKVDGLAQLPVGFVLSDPTHATLTYVPDARRALSPGVHTVWFQVANKSGVWSTYTWMFTVAQP